MHHWLKLLLPLAIACTSSSDDGHLVDKIDDVDEPAVDSDAETDVAIETDTPPGDGRGSWIDTHMHVRNGGTGSLLQLMDDEGVEFSVLVNVPETFAVTPGKSFCDSYVDGELVDDLGVIQAARDAYPHRFAVGAGGGSLGPKLQCTPAESVGTLADPSSPISAFRAEAESLANTPGFVGFGEMISLHLCMNETHSYQVALANHPLFLELGRVAAELDVPIDLHMEAVPEGGLDDRALLDALNARCERNPDDELPATIPALLDLLETGATVVWQHAGWDNTGYFTPEVLQGVFEDCDKAGPCNLFIALRVPPDKGNSPLMTYSGGLPTNTMDPDWKAFIETHSERVMIGADEFVGSTDLPPGFTNTWSLVLPQFDEDVALEIGSLNARRVYSRLSKK